MKKIFPLQILFFTLIFFGGIFTNSVNAQCETWLNPTNSPAFNDFNRVFFGAPCASDDICSINQIEDFEVFASEAYRVNFFRKGGVYSFSMCNGPGAGSWVPEFTIIAPSGAIDAFGSGDGDSCTITWTASEDGEYFIAINEQGFCGGGDNTTTSNGFPALSCISNSPCAIVDTLIQCYQWLSHDGPRGYENFDTEFGGAPCDDGSGCQTNSLDIEAWASEAYTMENIQEGGKYSFNICSGPGAGSWLPEFTIIAPNGVIDASGTDADSCTITWTASLSGTYLIVINEMGFCNGGDNLTTNNGFPSISCISGTMCDSTMMASCVVGDIVSETNVVVCGDQDSVIIVVENVTIPEGGGFAYGFLPGESGTGGNGTGFTISGSSPSTAFDNGIGGLLEANNLDDLQGEWIITPFVYTEAGNASGSSCELSDASITVFFNEDIEVDVQDLGSGSAMVTVSGGTGPYSYKWSDPNNMTTKSVEGLTEGAYTVMVTDEVGCTAVGEVNIMLSSISNQKGIQDIKLTPNPTDGQLWIDIQHLNVNVKLMDINGRVLTSNKYRSTSGKVLMDLSSYVNGVYFVNIETESEMINRKIILTK